MKLIRTLHKSINEGTSLIIFCENKILYDQNDCYTYSQDEVVHLYHPNYATCFNFDPRDIQQTILPRKHNSKKSGF